ncbi:MAG: MCE family protein [Deltaproteobacteria bacterium]|nr:MCE family protein [Deltaproteobacteria bacterium]
MIGTGIRRWAALLSTAGTLGCAPTDVVQLQLDDTQGLKEEASVLLDGKAIGSVSNLRFARQGSAAVAELTLDPEAFARLDVDTIWAVRPASESDRTPVVLATNLCVETPRGLSRRADVRGHGAPLFRMLPAIAEAHAACIEKKGGFAALRKALGAPAGLGAAVRGEAAPTPSRAE